MRSPYETPRTSQPSQDWRDQALCRETDPEAFFPENGSSARQAEAICRDCPVRAECLAESIRNHERHGVWGGLSERKRRPLIDHDTEPHCKRGHSLRPPRTAGQAGLLALSRMRAGTQPGSTSTRTGSMTRPRLLDLYCGAGGASMGYHRAGFDVVGVDINPQPNYPFEFHQADALKFLLENWHQFDAFHASPPCQAFTNAQRLRGNDHPDFIRATREAFRLIRQGRLSDPTATPPYTVIENVPGAPLMAPIVLCGAMFDLGTYRHRLFETHLNDAAPDHPVHAAPMAKMGRPPRVGEFMHVVGNFSGVAQARDAMGIDWMTRDELRESIPPAYTEWLGRRIAAAMTPKAVA